MTRLESFAIVAQFEILTALSRFEMKTPGGSVGSPPSRSLFSPKLYSRECRPRSVTKMLRQGESRVFKKYSQMKLQLRREVLEKLNRQAKEMTRSLQSPVPESGVWHISDTKGNNSMAAKARNFLESIECLQLAGIEHPPSNKNLKKN
jgi:hypothetical protein